MEYRPGATNPANGLSQRPDYMQGEILYKDVLPTLTKKLHLAAELPEPAQQAIASLQVSDKSPTVLKAYVSAVWTNQVLVDGSTVAWARPGHDSTVAQAGQAYGLRCAARISWLRADHGAHGDIRKASGNTEGLADSDYNHCP